MYSYTGYVVAKFGRVTLTVVVQLPWKNLRSSVNKFLISETISDAVSYNGTLIATRNTSYTNI